MKRVSTIILFFFCFSCQKKENNTVTNLKETSSKFINFNYYTFNTTKGSKEKIILDEHKKYILDFWYLECSPCVKQHKEIKENLENLNKNNIEVIGISIDASQQNWINYLKSHQYNWKNYNQFYGDNILKNDLEIKLFPSYFIVDSKGNIMNKFNSFQKVMNHLKLTNEL